MFQYEYEKGDYARAIIQAKAYNNSDPLNRVKGNLGEIAFHEFCRQYLAMNQWHWYHGENIRRGEIERTEHDFAVLGHDFDVKARTDLNYFYYLTKDEISSDYSVLVWLRDPASVEPNQSNPDPRTIEYGVLLGYISRRDLPEERGKTDSYRFKRLNERPLSDLTELEPDNSRGGRHMDANGNLIELGDIVVDIEQSQKDSHHAIVVEKPDVPAYKSKLRIKNHKQSISQYRGLGDNTKFDPEEPIVGLVFLDDVDIPELNRVRRSLPKALASRVDSNNIYRYPASRIRVKEHV